MHEAKNTQRALVRIGYDGTVHKQFRGAESDSRFENEVRVLKYLELRKCPFVPRLLEANASELKIVTTNCGARVEHLTDAKVKELFDGLEQYGVRHDDPFQRNITYRASDGRFCIIDFEFAEIIGSPGGGENVDITLLLGGDLATRNEEFSNCTVEILLFSYSQLLRAKSDVQRIQRWRPIDQITTHISNHERSGHKYWSELLFCIFYPHDLLPNRY